MSGCSALSCAGQAPARFVSMRALDFHSAASSSPLPPPFRATFAPGRFGAWIWGSPTQPGVVVDTTITIQVLRTRPDLLASPTPATLLISACSPLLIFSSPARPPGSAPVTACSAALVLGYFPPRSAASGVVRDPGLIKEIARLAPGLRMWITSSLLPRGPAERRRLPWPGVD